ncbi:MAG: hypothetical protein PHN56_06515 [Candidatus Nanoarchaeia archaeon]|nr:hypothetical protein [Candidatus Nanoarchaeia archaeon]
MNFSDNTTKNLEEITKEEWENSDNKINVDYGLIKEVVKINNEESVKILNHDSLFNSALYSILSQQQSYNNLKKNVALIESSKYNDLCNILSNKSNFKEFLKDCGIDRLKRDKVYDFAFWWNNSFLPELILLDCKKKDYEIILSKNQAIKRLNYAKDKLHDSIYEKYSININEDFSSFDKKHLRLAIEVLEENNPLSENLFNFEIPKRLNYKHADELLLNIEKKYESEKFDFEKPLNSLSSCEKIRYYEEEFSHYYAKNLNKKVNLELLKRNELKQRANLLLLSIKKEEKARILENTPLLKKDEKLDEADLRKIISDEIPGMGYKCSSMWMNNLGYKNVLTIDRHILHFLDEKKDWIIENYNPKFSIANSYLERSGIGSENTYIKFESAFKALPKPEFLSNMDYRQIIWYIKSHKVQLEPVFLFN